jgi:hypothetical protein
MGTIFTGLILLVIITAVILKIRKDRKANNSAGTCTRCPCGCAKVNSYGNSGTTKFA